MTQTKLPPENPGRFNANVAVLGDAEPMIVFATNNELARVVFADSIDTEWPRTSTCNVLE